MQSFVGTDARRGYSCGMHKSTVLPQASLHAFNVLRRFGAHRPNPLDITRTQTGDIHDASPFKVKVPRPPHDSKRESTPEPRVVCAKRLRTIEARI